MRKTMYKLCSCGKLIKSTSRSIIAKHRKMGHIIPIKVHKTEDEIVRM